MLLLDMTLVAMYTDNSDAYMRNLQAYLDAMDDFKRLSFSASNIDRLVNIGIFDVLLDHMNGPPSTLMFRLCSDSLRWFKSMADSDNSKLP
ncbi:hypothetical protein OROMI_019748 [Orobanche minor]